MASLKSLFVTSALILAAVVPAFCEQSATVYDQTNGNGNWITIRGDYVADLSRINFDNKIRSVCLTGIWLFYQDTEYNRLGARGMEYVFGRDNYCANIRTIAGTISSMRFAGDRQSYERDTLTIYEGDWFQGAEEYTLTDLPNLNLAGNHKSIIITGNSAWTVYDRPSYQGNSLCLRVPGDSTPSFLSDLQNLDPEIPHGSIKSIRKGCHSSTTHTMTSFARTNSLNAFTFHPPQA